MPLNTVSKTNPNNPNSQPAPRPQTQLNPQSVSTARAEALKARLRAPQQMQAPRHAGSTARAEQYAQQPKYAPPAPHMNPPPSAPAPQVPLSQNPQVQIGRHAGRPAIGSQQPMSNIEPPPSGDPNVRAGNAAPAPAGITPPAPVAPPVVEAAPVAAATPPAPTGGTPTNSIGTPPAAAEAPSAAENAQFAALARKERLIRKAQQDLKAAQDAWKQEQAKYISKDTLKSKPLEALSEVGLTYDQLVEQQIAQANPDPQQPLLDKIAQLEERLAKVDQTFAERDTLAEQQALKQYRTDVDLLVSSDPAYETIHATDSQHEVVDLIHRSFKEDGVLLSVEEAAGLVEEKLVAREQARIEKLMQLQKFKSKLAPPTPAPSTQVTAETVEATPPQPQAQQVPTTTLTNVGASQRPMTPRERAIARIKGEL